MKVGVITFSKRGNQLAIESRKFWPDMTIWSKYENSQGNILPFGELHDCVKQAFLEKELLIFIGATGIAVRLIAPCLIHKRTDPAILVVDETGKFVISLVSGHLGGANAYAKQLASHLGGTAVITTATDCNGLQSPDLFAKENHFAVQNQHRLKMATALLLEQGYLTVLDVENRVKDLPQEYKKIQELEHNTGLVIHWKLLDLVKEECYLIPRVVCLGIGCKRGKSKKELQEVVENVLEQAGIFKEAILRIGTIDLKANEEGLVEFAQELGCELDCYSAKELNQVKGNFHRSEFVAQVTGVDNVCERGAILASRGGELMISRVAQNGVTVAVAVIKGA